MAQGGILQTAGFSDFSLTAKQCRKMYIYVIVLPFALSPWRPWHDAMPIVHLGQLRARCLWPGPLPELRVQGMSHGYLYVRYRHEARRSGVQLGDVLMRRARPWNQGNQKAIVGAWMSWVRTGPPAEFVIAVAYAAMYAWCTSARFGLDLIPCRFGCGEAAGERQTHYRFRYVCPG